MGHLMDSMQEVVNTTVNETRERTMIEQGEPCLNSELRDTLKKEQKQSIRFEKMLEDAVREDYVHKESYFSGGKSPINTDDEETNENVGGNLTWTTRLDIRHVLSLVQSQPN